MLRLIPVFTMLMCLAAQPTTAATISGTVTDAGGRPIKGARLDHTGRTRVVASPVGSEVASLPEETRTDADGHFRVTTVAPAIVVRSPGYESQRLRVTGDEQVEITLQRIKTASRCKLSPPPEVKTQKANDVDYTATWFYVETKAGPKGVFSGRGPMYSFGAPSDEQVWTSVEYAEVMFESGTIDAAGRSADGKYWRWKGIFGASAQYYNVDRETAEQLDCVWIVFR